MTTTDNLRAIANDLDELGEELDDFVLLAGVRNGQGPVVRVLSSWTDAQRDQIVAALHHGIRMLRGGAEQ